MNGADIQQTLYLSQKKILKFSIIFRIVVATYKWWIVMLIRIFFFKFIMYQVQTSHLLNLFLNRNVTCMKKKQDNCYFSIFLNFLIFAITYTSKKKKMIKISAGVIWAIHQLLSNQQAKAGKVFFDILFFHSEKNINKKYFFMS